MPRRDKVQVAQGVERGTTGEDGVCVRELSSPCVWDPLEKASGWKLLGRV